MNSSKTLDNVIQYLEKAIADGGEIDYNVISKIAASPAAIFQRIFIFISGVSIAEYVRKRRLALAGQDLKNGGISVIDAAIKYGFHSHSAFTRAFKEFHGITPTEAKNGADGLKHYPPLQTLDLRLIGGKRIMAEMKKIVYQEAEGRIMAGMHRMTSFQEGGEAWKEFFQSGTIGKLDALSDVKCCDDIDDNAGIGMMYNFQDMDHFEIIIGDFIQAGVKIPNGLDTKYVPGGLTAHIQIEGNNIGDILDSAYFLITEAIEKTGKQIDQKHFYWCEIYTNERYCKPLERGEKVIMDYILPVLP